jgi:hypothetical protein
MLKLINECNRKHTFLWCVGVLCVIFGGLAGMHLSYNDTIVIIYFICCGISCICVDGGLYVVILFIFVIITNRKRALPAPRRGFGHHYDHTCCKNMISNV